MAPQYRRLLDTLSQGLVDFIVIGGVAGFAHGAARLTFDVDVVYSRTRSNLEKLAAALLPLHPYLRGAPEGLPFRFDVETLRRGLNFTLVTDAGDLDLLGEVAGGGTYENLIASSEEIEAYGVLCRVVSLSKLIELKRAAGRPKDFEAIAELEALQEEVKSLHKPPSQPDRS